MKAIEIPPEILCEVLSYFSTTLIVNRTSSFPWYLGHICASWRATFLSMHQFWTRIDINLLSWSLEPVEELTALSYHAFELVQMFLERTQGRLFAFRYQAPYNSALQMDPLETRRDHQILHALADCSDRWVGASLSLYESDLHILQPVKGRLPHLRMLETHYLVEDNRELDHPYIDVFRDVALEHVYLVRPMSWAIDYTGLSSLYIGELRLFETELFLELLRQTHCLQELVVLQTWVAAFPRKSTPPVMLPHVKLFAIGGGIVLFPFLMIPALEDFSVYTGGFNPHFQPTILAFLACHHQIRSFTAYNCMSEDMFAFLEYMPNLTSLSLCYVFPMLDVFMHLTHCRHHEEGGQVDIVAGQFVRPVLPKLRALSMTSHLTRDEVFALAEMVDSRMWMSSAGDGPAVTHVREGGIQELTMHLADYKRMYPLVSPTLSAMEEKGVEVSVDDDLQDFGVQYVQRSQSFIFRCSK
ncbi:hypothetical protein AMATHDRAFT_8063 [Amanita thiersii Skay4041]|uniref:F-box domain-containing protein n=1 Tax=Amanita thiersii Skay4041 TaxID=703135 RepID=A0A2A9NEP9_9AGAR|nr:hypothetical protein AMATHDRAFT_8063 [Amanita thiersii Skay4041]